MTLKSITSTIFFKTLFLKPPDSKSCNLLTACSTGLQERSLRTWRMMMRSLIYSYQIPIASPIARISSKATAATETIVDIFMKSQNRRRPPSTSLTRSAASVLRRSLLRTGSLASLTTVITPSVCNVSATGGQPTTVRRASITSVRVQFAERTASSWCPQTTWSRADRRRTISSKSTRRPSRRSPASTSTEEKVSAPS